MSVSIVEVKIRRIAETSDFQLVRASDIHRLIKEGFDTLTIARAYSVREAQVWNRLAHDIEPARRF